MDGSIMMESSSDYAVPTLRRNKKIDLRWSPQYYTLLRNAVFVTPEPYVPAEPPPSLSEDISESEPLYVCKQCKDCFRFSTSFEDHNARRSWILGFWCQYCFLTICTHVPKGASPCSQCYSVDKEKRSYIRKRCKSHKLRATRVFYNQCQFFAHLKMHNLTSLDTRDIILMPMPNIDCEWTPALHRTCEALMENAFFQECHLLDWLKASNIENIWWRLATENKNNIVTEVVRIYKGDELFQAGFQNKKEDYLSSKYPSSTYLSHDNDKSTDYPLGEGDVSDQNVSENEDNPCTPADIAFVDCGPTPKFLVSESVSTPLKRTEKRTTCFVKFDQKSMESSAQSNSECKKRKELSMSKSDEFGPDSVAQKSSDQYVNAKKFKADGKNKITNVILEDTVGNMNLSNIDTTKVSFLGDVGLKKRSYLRTHNTKQLHSSPGNRTILRVQAAKDADFNTIINQLPPYLINNKKIVFIGQDDEVKTQAMLKETLASNKVQVTHSKEKPINKTISKVINVQKNTKTNRNKIKQTDVQKSVSYLSISGDKIVYQNGRKYIIKQSGSSEKNTTASKSKNDHNTSNTKLLNGNLENTLQQQNNVIRRDVFPLTPSPSPSELSTSSCETYNKQLSLMSEASKIQTINEYKETRTELFTKTPYEHLSFHKGKDDAWYLNIKLSYFDSSIPYPPCDMSKYKKEMIRGFQHLTYKELKLRTNHLKEIREKVLSQGYKKLYDDKFMTQNVKVVKEIQMELQEHFNKFGKNVKMKDEVLDDFEMLLTDWEAEIKPRKNDENLKCGTCNKITKPKSYIPGFSKLSNDDGIYCVCYKNVCHLCNSYQGTITRFIAHQNFHEKEKPYACPDCWRRFNDFQHLNNHTWVACFHMMSKRSFGCNICEIVGFPDIESIARHFAIMHSYKKLACELCYSLFPTFLEYKRHCRDVHYATMNKPIKLVVCRPSKCITKCESFMSHIEKHSGVLKIIWYKCPFCSYNCFENKRTSDLLKTHFQTKHLYRLPELFNAEILTDMLSEDALKKLVRKFPKLFTQKQLTQINVNLTDSLVPKIINTRTIPSEVFEHGSPQDEENEDKELMDFVIKEETTKQEVNVFSVNEEDGGNVVNVKNEQLQMSSEDLEESNSLPKILEVRSIAKDSEETPQAMEKMCDRKSKSPETLEETKIDVEEQIKESESIIDTVAETCKEALINVTDSNIEPADSVEHSNESTNCKETDVKEEIDSDIELINKNTETEKKIIHSNIVGIEKNEILIKLLEEDLDHSKLSCCELNPPLKNNDSSIDYQQPNKRLQIRVKDIEELRTASFIDETEVGPSSSVLKPPPLSRIPEHLLHPVTSDEAQNILEENAKTENVECQIISDDQKNSEQCRQFVPNSTIIRDEKSEYFLCHLCGQLVSTSWSVVRSHFKTVHSEECKLSIATSQFSKVSLSSIKIGLKSTSDFSESSAAKKQKFDCSASNKKRRNKWNSKKPQGKYLKNKVEGKNLNLADMGICVEQETAKDADGNFKCKKCDQSCTDMADLREHIASTHRIKGRYLICLECGENFVVAPSLQMHLKAFHGIEDPITYMAQNTSYAPDVAEDSEGEGKTTVANQCHVCMAVFEDKAAVDKHLRVHGMAFLNRKRIEARNAMKSPEKKNESEQKSQNPAKEDTKSAKDNVKTPVKRDDPADAILEKINAML